MPSQSHPQAQFVPIFPELNLSAIVDNFENFHHVTRVSTEELKEQSIQDFERSVFKFMQSGRPLVIEDWGVFLPPWLFSRKWLEENLGTKAERVRDIPNEVEIPMTIGHYLRSMDKLTNPFFDLSYKDPRRQRLYLKDIDTPDAWAEHLKQNIPECIYYLNDCVESRTGGDGSIREPNQYGQMRYGKGVAPAGDLMSSLPPEMRAENMMCYIGHEGTYTAAHREMCATLGYNIMVEASQASYSEKEGSSIWFMTETKEREVVSEYFLSMLGHDIEVEKHFAQINAWKKAPFNVWVVEQKVGDLILIPPLAPHQVWNRGTRTMKVAWNRTTVDTLELALHEALPRARMVCRDEQYKCKAIVYYTLMKYYDLLQRDTIEEKMWKYGRIKQLLYDFKRLFGLYTEILVSEMFSPKFPEEELVELVEFDSNITCSYCRCNIFNRFLTCKSCIQYGLNGEEDTYDVCMDCYAMGRSCACISNLSWVEQWNWNTLVQNYEQWRDVVVRFDGYFDKVRSPLPIEIARKRYGRKPIAEVCQEQLRFRPWTDITKPREPTPNMSDIEEEVDDEGRPKTRKGGKRSKFSKPGKHRPEPAKDKTHTCHICCHHDWNWKLAFCTTCSLAYCYGVLWRAFDMMPQTVMEDKEWQCPRCMKMCSCGKCRKGSTQTSYQPKGTLLGHDTRKVADYRSVESLVDFSKTNLGWLRDENADNPQQSARMKKLKEKAEADKARVDTMDESYLDNTTNHDPFTNGATNGDSNKTNAHGMDDIDPELRGLIPTHLTDNGNRPYRSPYKIQQAKESNGDVHDAVTERDDDSTQTWMDGHDDLDNHASFNTTPATYSSKLLVPVAPMLVPEEEPYYASSHVGQNRMMGIGYYQQGNELDRIIYYPPNLDGSFDDTSQRNAISSNPNLALSDLVDSVLQQPETSKKRKRLGYDGSNDEEDVEVFTSKRQKLLAESKKSESHNLGDEVSHEARPDKRPPRRSTVKPQSYTDLGEDAVLIEDEETPAVLSHRKHKADRKVDLEASAQVMKNHEKPINKDRTTTSVSRKKGRRMDQSGSGSHHAAPNMIKTPRQSAWLVRKEAEENGADFSAELPKRSRSRRSQIENDAANLGLKSVGIPSGLDDDDGGTAIGDADDDEDGLRKEPNEQGTNSETSISWRQSGLDSKVQVAVTTTSAFNEVQHKSLHSRIIKDAEKQNREGQDAPDHKHRGRPLKNAAVPVNVGSPSPLRRDQAPIKKLLSLKEKLALKRKTFRIVATKSGPGLRASSSTPSAQTIPTTFSPSVPIPSIPNRADWNPVKGVSRSSKSNAGGPRPATASSQPSIASPISAPPAKKGPTVVRLMSPSSSSVDSESQASDGSVVGESSSEDDDASIPAIRKEPEQSHSGVSLRGGRAPRRGNRARRGRQPVIRSG